jgi:hypothetical protein
MLNGAWGSVKRTDAQPLESMMETWRGRLSQPLYDFFRKTKSNIFGRLTNDAFAQKVIRAMFDEHVDDEAFEASKAARQVLKDVIHNKQRLGIKIKELKDYNWPQALGGMKVRALDKNYDVAKESFVNFIMPMLDREKMVDNLGNTLDDNDLKSSLEHVFDTLVGDGANKRVEAAGWLAKDAKAEPGDKWFSNMNDIDRFLHYKDADSWLAVHEKLGKYSIVESMYNYIRHAATEIAAADRFGPDYIKNFEDVLNFQAQEIEKDPKAFSKKTVQSILGSNRAVFENLVGQRSEADYSRLAKANDTLNKLVSSAALVYTLPKTAITDPAWALLTTKAYNGSFGKVITDFAKLFSGLGRERQLELANQLGLVHDLYNGEIQSRWMELKNTTDGFAGAASNFTLRGGLLHRWTEGWKYAVAIQTAQHLGSLTDRALGDLPAKDAKLLRTFNISSKDWDTLRSYASDVNGYPYIDTNAMLKDTVLPLSKRNELYSNYNGALNLAKTRAIPHISAKTSAFLSGDLKPVSIGSILVKNAKQFHTFEISSVYNALDMIANAPAFEGIKSKLMGIASVGSLGIGLGALGLQLGNIIKGKTLEPMDSHDFWTRAFFKTFGVGFAKDLAVGDYPTQDAFTSALGGASGAAVDGLLSVLYNPVVAYHKADSMSKGLTDAKDSLVHNGLRFASRYTPAQTWYTNWAVQHMVLDNIKKAVDPKAHKAWERMQREAAKNRQGYWWAPGQTLP